MLSLGRQCGELGNSCSSNVAPRSSFRWRQLRSIVWLHLLVYQPRVTSRGRDRSKHCLTCHRRGEWRCATNCSRVEDSSASSSATRNCDRGAGYRTIADEREERRGALAKGVLWHQRAKSKNVIVSQERRKHDVFTHHPKEPNGEVCKMANTTQARCDRKAAERMDGVEPSTHFRDLVTADHKMLNVANESRCGHKITLIRQDEVTIWIQASPMKTEITSETVSCLQRFLPPSQKPEKLYKQRKELIEACQEMQCNGITIQALLIAQKRTAWSKKQSAKRRMGQLSHLFKVANPSKCFVNSSR